MPLHDAVMINGKKGLQRLKIKAQVPSIWAKGCILMIVCVLSDLTCLPLLGGRRKSWYIIIILLLFNQHLRGWITKESFIIHLKDVLNVK